VKVCVVGSGGREHALARALAQTADVVVTPGNPGMAAGGIACSDLAPEQTGAELVVVGPEQPLVEGLADRLRAEGKLVFGPGADGARLEGSKGFMKRVLDEARVPSARYGVFDDEDDARAFLRSLPGPFVVKTDGLAAGKGVLVTDDLAEAEADVAAKLSGASFGAAGKTVVVEEGLVGAECSLLALCDGTRIAPLPVARDYKRLEDGDEGPNTGGMGSVCAPGIVPDRLVDQILATCVEPVVGALRRRGVDYRGVLYAGLILTAEGPMVLEYNVRFGDPETQVVLPRITEDVTALLAEAASGRLRTDPRASKEAAVCVGVASSGYPSSPRTGDPIEGLEAAGELTDTVVLHAGTGVDERGRLVTAGGRVLNVVGCGASVDEARHRAYAGVEVVGFDGMRYRRDIALRAAVDDPLLVGRPS
jgi:phosphoribosylamine---glycine ligase